MATAKKPLTPEEKRENQRVARLNSIAPEQIVGTTNDSFAILSGIQNDNHKRKTEAYSKAERKNHENSGSGKQLLGDTTKAPKIKFNRESRLTLPSSIGLGGISKKKVVAEDSPLTKRIVKHNTYQFRSRKIDDAPFRSKEIESEDTLRRKAKRTARYKLREKLSHGRYSSLSFGQKQIIDNLISKHPEKDKLEKELYLHYQKTLSANKTKRKPQKSTGELKRDKNSRSADRIAKKEKVRVS